MTDKVYYSCFDSPFGLVFIAKTIRGLCSVRFLKISEAKFLSLLRKRFQDDIIRNDKELENVKKNLLNYFNGYLVNFKNLLDLSMGTEFQRKVWYKVKGIPYGELRSYKWVAKAIGSVHAARAVGNAVGKNPIPPIVPCHRVICTDGSLGGYTSGVAIKKKLLKLEGIAERRFSR